MLSINIFVKEKKALLYSIFRNKDFKRIRNLVTKNRSKIGFEGFFTNNIVFLRIFVYLFQDKFDTNLQYF